MSADSETPNIIGGNWMKYCTVAKSMGRSWPIWASVVVCARVACAPRPVRSIPVAIFLRSRCAERCANDAFLTSFQATLSLRRGGCLARDISLNTVTTFKLLSDSQRGSMRSLDRARSRHLATTSVIGLVRTDKKKHTGMEQWDTQSKLITFKIKHSSHSDTT